MKYLLPIIVFLTFLIGSSGVGADFPDPSTDNLPPRTVPEVPKARPVPDWLRTNVRYGEPPNAKGRMFQDFIKAGYNVITVNALMAWDRVGPSAELYSKEEVAKADEYMRTAVADAHRVGAKILFYCCPNRVHKFSEPMRKAHPDWRRVLPDGKYDAEPDWANLRSGHGEWLLKQLAYVTKEYKVDGFWFDGYAPQQLNSYDEKTKAEFRKFSGGKEIPTNIDPVKDPVSRQYQAWHEAFFVKFADQMRGAIRKENPEAVILVNYSADRTWYFPEHYMGDYPAAYCRAIDVPSVELYWDIPGDALYQQFCYAFMQCVTRDNTATCWVQPSEHGMGGISSPIEMQLRGIEGTPWGVYAEMVEATGREDYMKTQLQNIKAREEWFIKSQALPYIGLVVSEQTRNLYAHGALPVYFSHALGAFRSIFEKHLPVRVLNEYDLEDANLQGVRVLVMPNVVCLSDRACEVVRRFVASGGGLVASFETSMYDTEFARRKDFALGDVFKAKYLATDVVQQRTENLTLRVTKDHEVVNGPVIQSSMYTAWQRDDKQVTTGTLSLIASAAEVEPQQGAEVLATYIVADEKKREIQHPAVMASTYGKGRVVYFPASIDKAMFYYPDRYMREMIMKACLWTAQEKPPVEVEAPMMLAVTFRRQPDKGRTIVHLLNDASSWGRHSIYQKLAPLPDEIGKQWGFPNQSELRGTWATREELIPIHDIKVKCRVPGVKKAMLQPENLALDMKQAGDGVEVTVPKVEMHSMVIFE